MLDHWFQLEEWQQQRACVTSVENETLHMPTRSRPHLRAGRHDGAGARSAELLQGAKQDADGVVEVYCVDCQPLIEVLTCAANRCIVADITLLQSSLNCCL